MWKAGLAGVVALVIGSSVAFAGSSEADFDRSQAVTKSGAVMSLAQVSRLKSVLKLTAAQEQLWPAIERAFHEISQAQEPKRARAPAPRRGGVPADPHA